MDELIKAAKLDLMKKGLTSEQADEKIKNVLLCQSPEHMISIAKQTLMERPTECQ